MKTLVVRLPDHLFAEIDAEARLRHASRSDVVRDRLARGAPRRRRAAIDSIADLIGSVEDDRPADLSERTKEYLRATGYGRKRAR